MRASLGVKALTAVAILALAGCGGNGQPSLMNLRSSTQGPDEFGIVPPKPLDMPEDLAALPEPTPGGVNRTDPTPLDDAVVALGGQPGAGSRIPAGDGALYTYASRFGVAGDIRATLAAEDLEYRRDNNGRVLERLLDVNVYYRAYRRQSLDQHAELAYWRARGLPTPSAPPPKPAE
ncbi:MAG: DUF3035 domain-containing protein [Pseudomonadota bacterium]